MKASGKSASRAPAPAISLARPSILSIVAARSKGTDSAWTQATFATSFTEGAYFASPPPAGEPARRRREIGSPQFAGDGDHARTAWMAVRPSQPSGVEPFGYATA